MAVKVTNPGPVIGGLVMRHCPAASTGARPIPAEDPSGRRIWTTTSGFVGSSPAPNAIDPDTSSVSPGEAAHGAASTDSRVEDFHGSSTISRLIPSKSRVVVNTREPSALCARYSGCWAVRCAMPAPFRESPRTKSFFARHTPPRTSTVHTLRDDTYAPMATVSPSGDDRTLVWTPSVKHAWPIGSKVVASSGVTPSSNGASTTAPAASSPTRQGPCGRACGLEARSRGSLPLTSNASRWEGYSAASQPSMYPARSGATARLSPQYRSLSASPRYVRTSGLRGSTEADAIPVSHRPQWP